MSVVCSVHAEQWAALSDAAAAALAGMGREVENLISENNELLATK